MTSTIRRATPDDLDAVRFLGVCTWPATYGPRLGARYVMRGLDEYWSAEAIGTALDAGRIDVAETSDGVVGMAEVDDLGDDLVLWKLYVMPSAQGSGLGHELVAAAKDRARRSGRDLLTEYEPANEVVRGFYLREGFEDMEAPWPGAVWLRWRA